MADSTKKDPGEARANPDVTGEFFSVGVPLHAVRAGYVRRRADELLHNALMAGRYAHVLAPDRSGKSSLISAIAARLESSGCKIAILDLAQLGDRDRGIDSGRWYYSVAYRLLRQLRVRYDLQSWWQDKSILSNRQRLFEFYSEVLLQHVEECIVIFVDEIQCIENFDAADQFLTSIRAAHNARATDPDFSRLCFVLSGECDPISLMQEAELSPFNVTQQVLLDDFSREELSLFATELNRSRDEADIALDRIYYWTDGQPYLTQKLARAVAREPSHEDVEALVDRIAVHQLAGRAALHSEPHMSHIHRAVVSDGKRCEPLLNLYGKIRKGIEVPADLGSSLQRRLMAIGLLVIDDESNVRIRNRLYGAVFTARWANENLPTRLRAPAMVAALLSLFVLVPFWYTQWLPKPYVSTLASHEVAIETASEAYENYRSFPGHSATAENIYRSFLQRRALLSNDRTEILELAALAAGLPDSGRLADQFEADFWDRSAQHAIRNEDRDVALLAKIRSLSLATSVRRQRAASLIADDYPYLLKTLPDAPAGTTVFDPDSMILTNSSGAAISQYSFAAQGLQQREPWSVTALEVSPLVRRVVVDRVGSVRRIGLTLNISHSRLADLRIKIIAPSGRTAEIKPGLDRTSSNQDIRIASSQLKDFLGESLNGTWSISIRDESLGVAGQLVGWNLTLNSQGAIESFQRGLNIPDPVERETDNIWLDRSARYAVARATQSDSARIWNLARAEPLRAITLPESEALIGLDASAKRLLTATQNTVNVWDTATGDKLDSLPVGVAGSQSTLTSDGSSLIVERRSDIETRLERWDLAEGVMTAHVVIAGIPALVSIDASGQRVAVADFDRSVRLWEFHTGKLLAQFDLPAQPSEIQLSASGMTLGAVYSNAGVSFWNVEQPLQPLLEKLGQGDWKLAFSPSGKLLAAGRSESGFQIFNSGDGRQVGPPLGLSGDTQAPSILAFSQDEKMLLTAGTSTGARLWRVPSLSSPEPRYSQSADHVIWNAAADRAVIAPPDGSYLAIGDPDGHVHVIPADATLEDLAEISGDVSFVGHSTAIRGLAVDASGQLLASRGADNSIRIWRADSGEPLPYVVEIDGPVISRLDFSPGANFLGVLNGSRVSIIASHDGSIVAEYDTGITNGDLTFATDDSLYFGDHNGALRLLRRGADDSWSAQHVWQGASGIRLLQVAPHGNSLILVDQQNHASQFILQQSRIGELSIDLPSTVREVAFDSSGSRVYFATARWVHLVNSSMRGLSWRDALLMPPPLKGATIVRGNSVVPAESGRTAWMPVARNGYIEFAEIAFGGSTTAGPFGSREDLLQEWLQRVSANRPEAF